MQSQILRKYSRAGFFSKRRWARYTLILQSRQIPQKFNKAREGQPFSFFATSRPEKYSLQRLVLSGSAAGRQAGENLKAEFTGSLLACHEGLC